MIGSDRAKVKGEIAYLAKQLPNNQLVANSVELAVRFLCFGRGTLQNARSAFEFIHKWLSGDGIDRQWEFNVLQFGR
jgi:hypothetical protein